MTIETMESLTWEELEMYSYEELTQNTQQNNSYVQKKIYLIEIFEPDFTYRSSMQVSDIDLEIDYLSLVKNKIKLNNIVAYAGDYIRISTSEIEIDGIITGTQDKKDSIVISYKTFFDLFDIDILCDPTDLTTTTMERFISNLITENYISNSDTLQNITGLSVSVMSGTSGTTLDISSNIVNFYKDIVYSAFLQYNIVIRFSISTQQKKILCTIEKNISPVKVIETRLPNILNKNIDLGVTKESYNKLIVINEASQTEDEIYYLHPDNTINTTNSNRITPVIFTTEFITIASGKTFSESAYDKAVSVLKQNEYNKLIEIETTINDSLINPLTLGIGQKVTVIDGENQHESILTGIKIGKTSTLIFGAVRKELSKKLKRRL